MKDENQSWVIDAIWASEDKKKGKDFEKIVEKILVNMFYDCSVIHTRYVHDGGKDFYVQLKGSNNEIWVEAKNHDRHLELSKFAGTFIMANVAEINQIIIFSTTELTDGALENIGRYGDMHNITITVFHGVDILYLLDLYDINASEYIINYDSIKEKYLSKFLYTDPKFSCKFFHADDMTHEYRRKLESGCKLKEVHRFDLIAIEITIKNAVISTSELIISYEGISNDDYNIMPIKVKKIVLKPGQVYSTTFFARVSTDKTTIQLPIPSIRYNKTNIELPDECIHQLPCHILGETGYIGKDNEKLSNLINFLNSKRIFSCVVVHGESGVGKTRFLREFASSHTMFGAKSFFFGASSALKFDFSDFAMNIITNFFNIEYGINYNEIKIYKKYIRQDKFLFDIVMNKSNISKYTKKFLLWLTSIMKTQPLVIIFDNAQLLSSDLIDFLLELLQIMRGAPCDSRICLGFNTEDMLHGTVASNFYYHLKGEFCPPENIAEVNGFDFNDAALYLQQSLDPNFIRDDLDELYNEIIYKVGTKPLMLKQIIMFLYQKGAVYFSNDSLVVANASILKEVLKGLPDTVFDVLSVRYRLLEMECKKRKICGLNDLFWLIELFGELPAKIISETEFFSNELISLCSDMGFIRYNSFQTLLFTHQLIAKSVLLKLEGKRYHPHPVMTKLNISKPFLLKLQNIIKSYETEYPIEKLLVDDALENIDCFYMQNYFDKQINYYNCNHLILPALVQILEKRIEQYQFSLNPKMKLSALIALGDSCEKNLGVKYSQVVLKSLVEKQLIAYEINYAASAEFVSLMKLYLYILPVIDQVYFLDRLEQLVPKLDLNNSQRHDLLIWINNRKCKSYQDMHIFDKAEESIKAAIHMADEIKDYHRLMECEVEYGNLFAYSDIKNASEHWNRVYEYSLKVPDPIYYDKIEGLVFLGNTFLINYDKDRLSKVVRELLKLREDRDVFVYLKLLIDDFICNYYILTALNEDHFHPKFHKDLEKVLKRYRKMALIHQTSYYLKSVYKSLIFYYLYLKNCRNDKEYMKSFVLMKNFSLELLENFSTKTKDTYELTFFSPVLLTIINAFKENNLDVGIINKKLPISCKEILLSMEETTIFPPKSIGFTDKNLTVNLLHFNYVW